MSDGCRIDAHPDHELIDAVLRENTTPIPRLARRYEGLRSRKHMDWPWFGVTALRAHRKECLGIGEPEPGVIIEPSGPDEAEVPAGPLEPTDVTPPPAEPEPVHLPELDDPKFVPSHDQVFAIVMRELYRKAHSGSFKDLRDVAIEMMKLEQARLGAPSGGPKPKGKGGAGDDAIGDLRDSMSAAYGHRRGLRAI